ncbi:hypothetical protein BDZ97DRAFT_1408370 [Flammula alnicola]|nr:hypothetical protein BDZ97DRAFT_1408370 [Flammula alnicola]
MDFYHTQSLYFDGLVDKVTFDPIPDQQQLYDPSIDWTFVGYGAVTPPPFDLGELHNNDPDTMLEAPFFSADSASLADPSDDFKIVNFNEVVERPKKLAPTVGKDSTVCSTDGLITPPVSVGELDADDINTVPAPPMVDTDPNRFLYADYIEQEISFDQTSPAYGLWTPPPEPQALAPFDGLEDLFDIAPSDGGIERPLDSKVPFNLTPSTEPQLVPAPFEDEPFPSECWLLGDPFSNYGGMGSYEQPAQDCQGVLGLSLASVDIPYEQAAFQSTACSNNHHQVGPHEQPPHDMEGSLGFSLASADVPYEQATYEGTAFLGKEGVSLTCIFQAPTSTRGCCYLNSSHPFQWGIRCHFP